MTAAAGNEVYTAGTFGQSAEDVRLVEVARKIVREVQHRHVGPRPRLAGTCELCRLLTEWDLLNPSLGGVV